MKPVPAAIAFGSNLADRSQNIDQGLDALSHHPGVRLTRRSSIIETDPVGGPPQGRFLNGVVLIETDLPPRQLLALLHKIEAAGGRRRQHRNEPREIDLDLLLYGDEIVLDPGCRIPHPRMHERGFVLQPLNEVASDWIHPERQQTIAALYADWCKRNEHADH